MYACAKTLTHYATCANFPIVTPTAQPESINIHPVNATTVRVSWDSGHDNFSTSIQYTRHCPLTGIVIYRHVTVLPPGVTSAELTIVDDEVSLDDGMDSIHNFTLWYFATSNFPGPKATATFTFGIFVSVLTLNITLHSLFKI